MYVPAAKVTVELGVHVIEFAVALVTVRMDEVAMTELDEFTICHLVYFGPVLDERPVQAKLEIVNDFPEATVAVKEMFLASDVQSLIVT